MSVLSLRVGVSKSLRIIVLDSGVGLRVEKRICATYNTLGKAACASKQIPEETLIAVTAEVMGTDNFDAEALHNKITDVRVAEGNTLVFCFKDGTEAVKRWADRSRAQSWTPEMRDASRKKTLERGER